MHALIGPQKTLFFTTNHGPFTDHKNASCTRVDYAIQRNMIGCTDVCELTNSVAGRNHMISLKLALQAPDRTVMVADATFRRMRLSRGEQNQRKGQRIPKVDDGQAMLRVALCLLFEGTTVSARSLQFKLLSLLKLLRTTTQFPPLTRFMANRSAHRQ